LHLRSSRGTLEDAFGNSATTGGLHFSLCSRFSIYHFFGVSENFSLGRGILARKSKKIRFRWGKKKETYLHLGRSPPVFAELPKAFSNPLRGNREYQRGCMMTPPGHRRKLIFTMCAVTHNIAVQTPKKNLRSLHMVHSTYLSHGATFFDYLNFFSVSAKIFRLAGTFYPENREKMSFRWENISTPR
jgi:hypothetical protein